MSGDGMVGIAGGILALLSLGSAVWRPIRRHLRWRREFRIAVRKINQGIEQNDERMFQEGLQFFTETMRLR